ncbi:hypothetical protein P8452_36872 [Trifolium repens]|nr:hypothetical protein P8452_36872 [Trifolium repens]
MGKENDNGGRREKKDPPTIEEEEYKEGRRSDKQGEVKLGRWCLRCQKEVHHASELTSDTPLLTDQYLVGLVPYLELSVVEKQSLIRLYLSIQILMPLFTLVVENVEIKWQRF